MTSWELAQGNSILTEGPLHTGAEGTQPCFPGGGKAPSGTGSGRHCRQQGTRGNGAWDLSSGQGEKVCGSDSPVGTSPVELPGAVQPSKASLSGRCPGLSVPKAGGEWWRGRLTLPPLQLSRWCRGSLFSLLWPQFPQVSKVDTSVRRLPWGYTVTQ